MELQQKPNNQCNVQILEDVETANIVDIDLSRFQSGYHALIYNDECHDMFEVIAALIACGKTENEAEEIMLKAHNEGVASVHHEEKTEEGFTRCKAIEDILRSFGLGTEVIEV